VLFRSHEEASNEVELWSKSAASQLDGQLRERRKNFARRIEAVLRIQEAAGGLDERIAELQTQLEQLTEDELALRQLTGDEGEAPASWQDVGESANASVYPS
jgi:hypothetical protein